MSALLLTLRGLKKSFGGVAALQPVSLDVFQGEILGLVGENGAGKSTMIYLFSGVHGPDDFRDDVLARLFDLNKQSAIVKGLSGVQ